MTDMTYDPDADAAYIRFSDVKVASTAEAGPFIYDLDLDGRIIGVEILSCSKVLAPGVWRDAPSPGVAKADAAE